MIKFTRVNDSFTEKAKRLIKTLGFGKNDVQTPSSISPFGIDSNPVKGMLAIQAESSVLGESVVIGYINEGVIAAKGETHLFSTNADGEEQFRIKLRDNGTIEIGGDADNAVRFSELKSGFDQLKTDFDNLVTAYNSHIHVTTATIGATAVVGVLSPTIAAGTPSTATIDASKIDEIKVP